MLIIPDWLFNFCGSISKNKRTSRIELRCLCGCDLFYVFKRKRTPEEELEAYLASQKWEEYWPLTPRIGTGKDGRTAVQWTIFGFVFKEKTLEEMRPKVSSFAYVSAKCSKCDREVVIFDERHHVFDERKHSGINYGELGPIKWSKDAYGIQCKFDYPEDAENGNDFGRVRIIKTAADKKSTVLDFEM